MSIQEWWWEYDTRLEQHERIKNASQNGGKFSGPEWDDARRRHKEKMNGKSRPA